MKFGEHLKESIAPEYGPDPYLDYGKLDDIIRDLSEGAPVSADLTNRQVSLTMPPPTNARGLPQSVSNVTEENFILAMDAQLSKVEKFTLAKVTELRHDLALVEAKLNKLPENKDELLEETDEIAEAFLRLEKYVNINFMGFHKILKKHDKHVPANPCKVFYVSRLHSQAWVRGDYSDLVVRLSTIYSTIRNDQAAPETADASQSFLRSTTKYWVKTEDVSRVKYAILRHLPVFLQKTSTGESDSQMTNSVYLDNDQLELYHGRLDKSPGAIALRLRWYGAGDPSLVFVERKTHREKWAGETSVKERFVIDESEVQAVMTNTYDIEGEKKKMLESGKSQKEADEWETLVREITQVISSKQLVPTMRTQYMRTAFQIPFDATVRVSLDTNLCMISERGYDLDNMKRWHRDPSEILAKNEITRFPHAVLEIKLELKGDNMTPPKWVTDLQNSGLLYEVHKFSKFIHGCAVMLPEDVRSVPYWVDDASVRESIIASGGERILAEEDVGVGPGANEVYTHLLPFGDTRQNIKDKAVGRTAASKAASQGWFGAKAANDNYGVNYYFEDEFAEDVYTSPPEEDIWCGEDTCCGWMFPFCSRNNAYYESVVAPTSVQKIEPKTFFANERTFLHWLHHGVILSSIAAAILAFSNETGEKWAHVYALALLPLSLAFCIYALNVFLWRADRIKTRVPGRWDDPRGPLLLGGILALILTVNFCAKLYHIATYNPEL
jgi:SPX domain protein involved in polyphosphate accumulation/uncharacterized membrane protein YidH (DUF202 family)